jgi:hypothetical protein
MHEQTDEAWHELRAHPNAPSGVEVEIKASIKLCATQLIVRFGLRGDLAALAIPSRSLAPGRRDRLWEHACCEAFIGAAGGAYVELNFSPSGDWAIWAFDDYRQGMREGLRDAAPSPRVMRGPDEIRIDAAIARASLREEVGAPPYRIGFAAVVEDGAGLLSYWACRHPGGRPDFHARDGWCETIYLPPTT